MKARLLIVAILLGGRLCLAQSETPGPAEQIVARHQQVLDQKRAIVNRIEEERQASQQLLEDYRKTKSKNLPMETLIDLVNAGVATTPREKFPSLKTPPVTPEERKVLEKERSPDGTSYLKVVEEIDKSLSDSEFTMFLESHQFLLRRNRWLRGKLGHL